MLTQSSTLPVELAELQARVQHNCHISDARFASDYTICVYLLKMREYFRWEKGYEFGTRLSNEEIGDWLTTREKFWETLEENEFLPLPVRNQRFDPFDSDRINRVLEDHGLLYSAGIGTQGRPHFFLARLEKSLQHEGCHIHVAAEEYARDLTAPPAMSRNGNVFIRRESLRRMLWEKLEEWRWSKPSNAMGRAIQCYDFDNNTDVALEAMTDTEIDTLVLHEIGEIKAGKQLGESWHDMIAGFPRSRLELMAQAVRDHLADAFSTLPALLQRRHPPSLHFYFANLSGMRKLVYPSLLEAYEHWVDQDDLAPLAGQIEQGHHHWLKVAREMIELHESGAKTAWKDIESLLENRQL
jgi:hypothetical protein